MVAKTAEEMLREMRAGVDEMERLANALPDRRKKPWTCPSCGREWPTRDAQDGYGCEDPNCPH